MEQVLCGSCKEPRCIEDGFYYVKGKRVNSCKICRRVSMRKYQKKFPEKFRKYQRKHYKLSPEEAKERKKKWHAENKDKINEKKRAAYHKNMKARPPKPKDVLFEKGLCKCIRCDEVKEIEFFRKRPETTRGISDTCKDCYNKSRNENRKDPKTHVARLDTERRYRKSVKGKATERHKRVRRSELPVKWAQADKNFANKFWNNLCVYCRNEPPTTWDHYIPLKDKECPGTIPTNMLPACNICNSSKGAKSPEEWIHVEEHKEIKKYFLLVQ